MAKLQNYSESAKTFQVKNYTDNKTGVINLNWLDLRTIVIANEKRATGGVALFIVGFGDSGLFFGAVFV